MSIFQVSEYDLTDGSPTPFLGIVSPRGCLMFRCTRGSNGSVERTGGEARCQVYQSLDSETPLLNWGKRALAYWSAWSNLEIQ